MRRNARPVDSRPVRQFFSELSCSPQIQSANILERLKNQDMKNDIVKIRWNDSYGVQSGWKDISDYKACLLEITSWGKVIFEDDKVIALAHNYADETENTCLQANGIMVIPKQCIIEIIPISSIPVSSTPQKEPVDVRIVDEVTD